jgi:hypothetical protein
MCLPGKKGLEFDMVGIAVITLLFIVVAVLLAVLFSDKIYEIIGILP